MKPPSDSFRQIPGFQESLPRPFSGEKDEDAAPRPPPGGKDVDPVRSERRPPGCIFWGIFLLFVWFLGNVVDLISGPQTLMILLILALRAAVSVSLALVIARASTGGGLIANAPGWFQIHCRTIVLRSLLLFVTFSVVEVLIEVGQWPFANTPFPFHHWRLRFLSMNRDYQSPECVAAILVWQAWFGMQVSILVAYTSTWLDSKPGAVAASNLRLPPRFSRVFILWFAALLLFFVIANLANRASPVVAIAWKTMWVQGFPLFFYGSTASVQQFNGEHLLWNVVIALIVSALLAALCAWDRCRKPFRPSPTLAVDVAVSENFRRA